MNDKNLLDEYITNNYNNLIKFANKCIQKEKRNYDSIYVISEMYISILNYKKKILCLDAFAKTWIKLNIKWFNSKINRENNNVEFELIDNITSKENYSISQIQIEEIMNNFYISLQTYEKALYNLFYNKNINSAKLIQEHLNISRSSAYQTYNECKELEKKFIYYINNQ